MAVDKVCISYHYIILTNKTTSNVIIIFSVIPEVTCSDESGKEYSEGDSYVDDDGKTCTCESEGSFACVCGDDVSCEGGMEPWTNEETCETQCISGEFVVAIVTI